jgi:glycosyltransferase involved in cell wall biosynthesis
MKGTPKRIGTGHTQSPEDTKLVVSRNRISVARGNRTYDFERNIPLALPSYDADDLIASGLFSGVEIESRQEPINDLYPDISVLMPCYNYARYMDVAIESVVSQSFVNWELLLVDDCSTDNTMERVQWWEKESRRIRCFYNKENRGLPWNRNFLFNHSKGKYICFLDPDDEYLLDKLQYQFDYMESNPYIAIMYGKAECSDGDVTGWTLEGNIYEGNPIPCQSVMIRQGVYRSLGGFREDCKIAEDWDMWIRAYPYYNFGFSDNVLYRLRKHQEQKGASESFDKKKFVATASKNRKKGSISFVVGSTYFCGGISVVHDVAKYMEENGWHTNILSIEVKNEGNYDDDMLTGYWNDVSVCRYANSYTKPTVVVSTHWTTMQKTLELGCGSNFALIQSDEPEWDVNTRVEATKMFSLPGFKHIIIADYMMEFEKKYGMNVVGKMDIGIDVHRMYPEWNEKREIKHRILSIGKRLPSAYDGLLSVSSAIKQLRGKYPDLVYTRVGARESDQCDVFIPYGTLSRDEIRGLYNNNDICIQSSTLEGSSVIVMEAMACGVPVVSTKVGVEYGIDTGKDMNITFVGDDNPKDLFSAIDTIFSNIDMLWWKLYYNGIKTAHSRSRENMCRQFMELIEGSI